jgi:VWFA-related protein
MRNQCSRVLLLLILMATAGAHHSVFGLSAPKDPEEPSNFTYHSSASEVRLVFFASDEHNRAVEELQKDDFAVVDDERVIRKFRSLTRPAPGNLNLVLLIDSSNSVGAQFQQEATDVLQLVAQWPWRPEDDISVFSFSGLEAHLICSADCRSMSISDQISSLPQGGATPLFDALEVAAHRIVERRQPDAWPVIVLFSDGEDTISKASFHDALEQISASAAQVYTVDVSSDERPSPGGAVLQELADDFAGRRLRIGEGVTTVFNQVMDDLHSARVVTYALPESSSAFHSVRILPTHNLNLQFRCRRGYYHYPGGAP